LPWAALLLAVLAVLARDGLRLEDSDGRSWLQRIKGDGAWFAAVWALLLVAVGAGWIWRDSLAGLWPTSLGFAAGCFMMFEAGKYGLVRAQPLHGLAAPAAFGVLGAALLTLIPVDAREPYQIGAAAGAGISAWILAGAARGPWASRAGILMTLCLAGDILGHRAAAGNSAYAGSLLGLAAVIALLLGVGLPRKSGNEASRALVGAGVGAVVLVLGSWLLGARHFYIGDVWMLFAGSAAVALIVAWLVPDDPDASGFGFVVSVILWLGVATLAFGLRKGFGMSIACLGGAAMLTLMGRTRAVLTLGPLAILVLYRIFRELHTDATRAVDIGQHYALIGLAVGAALPLLAGEWRASQAAGSRTAWSSALWSPAFLAVPFVSAVVLAAKGFVGVLAGLGFSSLVEGLRGSSRLEPLALQLGIGSAMIAGFGWLSDYLDLSREEKVKTLVWVAAGLFVVAAGIAILSRSSRVEYPRGSE
jgi:hypothetical protein